MVPAAEAPLAVKAATPKRRWWILPLGAALLVYLVLALLLARTKAPWFDEGACTNASYHLAFHGTMGSNVLEPTGMLFNAYFQGVKEHTYFNVPNNVIALAGWFRAFGFSIFSARCYSICWGVAILLALFYIVRWSFADEGVAALAVFFTGIDFVFLWSTADARADAAASALALGAIAVYLEFRERHFLKAVVFSQILGAAAVFTHPNAALVVLALGLLAWRFDRHRVRSCGWRGLGLAIAPYLSFGALWSLYIAQNPNDFRAQFFSNAAGRNSERLTKILHPDLSLLSEIDRHLGAYCIGGLWGGEMKGWMVLVPLLYVAPLLWLLVNSRHLKERPNLFTTYTVAMVLGLTFLNGFKGYFYLIYVLPLYNAVLAVWLWTLWRRNLGGKCIAAGVAVALAALQIAISVRHIRADEYHRDYLPAVHELALDRSAGKTILGDSALGFGLDYSGFRDDLRMGMYSGLSPDIVVIDRAYRMYAGYFAGEEPAVFQRIVTLLSTQYRLASQHGSFWIFEKLPAGAGAGAVPSIEMTKAMGEAGETRAQAFYQSLFAAYKMRDPEESSLY